MRARMEGMTVSLATALGDFALLALEGQDVLANYPGIDGPWQADLSACTVQIGQATFGATLIGSSSEVDNTFLWGWSNPAFGPEHPAVTPMLTAKATGERVGVAEYSQPKFSLAGVPNYGMHPGSAVAFMAARLAGLTAIYGGPYDGGVAYFGIVGLPLPAPDPVTFPRLAMAAIYYTDNIRQTIEQYARQRGLEAVPTSDGLTLNYQNGSALTCTFDSLGRLTGVQGSVSGA